MSGAVTITLDTTPPIATLASATQLGQSFEVEVTLDEPLITAARLNVTGHAPINMTVTGTTLTASLPANVTNQMAVIDVDVVDDVLNSATRQILAEVFAIESDASVRLGGNWVPAAKFVYLDGWIQL